MPIIHLTRSDVGGLPSEVEHRSRVAHLVRPRRHTRICDKTTRCRKRFRQSRNIGRRSQQLVRAIGRWSLTALVVNSVIGSGVFGLPSTVAGHLGKFSPLAVLLAGARAWA